MKWIVKIKPAHHRSCQSPQSINKGEATEQHLPFGRFTLPFGAHVVRTHPVPLVSRFYLFIYTYTLFFEIVSDKARRSAVHSSPAERIAALQSIQYPSLYFLFDYNRRFFPRFFYFLDFLYLQPHVLCKWASQTKIRCALPTTTTATKGGGINGSNTFHSMSRSSKNITRKAFSISIGILVRGLQSRERERYVFVALVYVAEKWGLRSIVSTGQLVEKVIGIYISLSLLLLFFFLRKALLLHRRVPRLAD